MSSVVVARYGPAALSVLAAIGVSIFIAYFVIAFSGAVGGGRRYEYSSPLAAMWTGIGTMWYSVSFLTWWASSRDTRNVDTREGLPALYVWALYSLLFAVEGFVALIGWAQAKNEAAASVFSFLWILVGGLAASITVGLLRAKRSVPPNKGTTQADLENGNNGSQSEVKTKRCSRCSWCCTKRFWVDFLCLFLITFLLVFSTGFMMQGISSASDANMVPPGQVYSFPLRFNGNTMDVQMHLYCFGEKSTSDSPTVILEHGGGANSLTMLALAEELESSFNTRACVYDRLGYGYTPTYYTSTGSGTSSTRLPNSGAILSQLLGVAGEAGPYVCAGHSAGGEACLWFAHEYQGTVTGIAILDGYPDLIRAGSFRPGIHPEGSGPLPAIQAVTVLAGGTGLTRGLVGDMGEDFVPSDKRGTVTSLYGQARFWFAQYWDVRSDLESDNESRLYQQLDGTVDENGIVTYGGTLSGTKILVIPAESTVSDIDCNDKDKGSYCCGNAKNSTSCMDNAFDRMLFREQSDRYAATLSNDTLGLVIQGPPGSEHGFVSHKDYYAWIATQIGEQLLSESFRLSDCGEYVPVQMRCRK
ncbi:unnamed protein product [Cylindrotheca closterium]|uniref:AB hydrolase-1 domain-containing protein n=1 Tax=Cylindrotheca closterium TaxID=2856 RepID=A0AAD2G2S6_9STRA|nr:unnamed protein product [Cylindrotheca closterium]